jgi:hypothetical protein
MPMTKSDWRSLSRPPSRNGGRCARYARGDWHQSRQHACRARTFQGAFRGAVRPARAKDVKMIECLGEWAKPDSTLSTFIVRDARRNRWWITVDGYGTEIHCLHFHCLGSKGNKIVYAQPCRANWPRKEAQARRLRELGYCAITIDDWSGWPKKPEPIERHRRGYVGLFNVHNVRFGDADTSEWQGFTSLDGATSKIKALRFTLGNRLCNLSRV